GEVRIVSEEAVESGLGVVLAAEDGDVGSAADAGAANNIGEAVAIDVGAGDANAARKVHVVGKEAVQAGVGVVCAGVNADVRSAAGIGAHDDVGEAVAIDVAGRH